MLQNNIYKLEILNFLKSITIKNSAKANLIKEQTIIDYGLDELSEYDNPYYKNLFGEYSIYDEMMYIKSLDTYEIIEYTKENLNNNPKTKMSYVIGSDFYKKLCDKYPLQKDLIKNIRYPVNSKKEAIESSNFSLLVYDGSLLQENEKDYIIINIKKYLQYIKERWYVKEFEYDKYYIVVFEYLIYGILFNYIESLRLDNLQSPYVHIFHVKEYLKSKGLGEYLLYLNYNQLMFLYKNIDYIYNNEGKKEILELITDQLLSQVGAGITYKEIYLNTKNSENTLTLIPEVITKKLNDKSDSININNIASLENFIYLLNENENVEPDISTNNINNLSKQLQLQKYTKIPTKYLQLNNNFKIRNFDEFVLNHINSMFVYGLVEKNLNYNLSLSTPYTDILILDTIDAYLLYNYCYLKSNNIEPTMIPTTFSMYSVIETPIIEYSNINKYFTFKNRSFNIEDFVDIKWVLDKFKITNDNNYKSYDEFLNLMMSHLEAFYYLYNLANAGSEILITDAVNHLLKQLYFKGTKTKQLLGDTLYQSWFDNRSDIKSLITNVDNISTDQRNVWKELSESIAEVTIYIPDMFTKYTSLQSNNKNTLLYLKNLLKKLSSYNICFLDTDEGDNSLFYDVTNLKYYHSSNIYTNQTNGLSYINNIKYNKGFTVGTTDIITNYSSIKHLPIEDNVHQDYGDIPDIQKVLLDKMHNLNIGMSFSIDI